MRPSQFASKLRQIADAINNSQNPRRDLVVQDLRRLIAVRIPEMGEENFCMECGREIEEGHDYCPNCCKKRRFHKRRWVPGDKEGWEKQICETCGEVEEIRERPEKPPKGRTISEMEADDAQTQWEKWRGI